MLIDIIGWSAISFLGFTVGRVAWHFIRESVDGWK